MSAFVLIKYGHKIGGELTCIIKLQIIVEMYNKKIKRKFVDKKI